MRSVSSYVFKMGKQAQRSEETLVKVGAKNRNSDLFPPPPPEPYHMTTVNILLNIAEDVIMCKCKPQIMQCQFLSEFFGCNSA
jgi:hypothetical protein